MINMSPSPLHEALNRQTGPSGNFLSRRAPMQACRGCSRFWARGGTTSYGKSEVLGASVSLSLSHEGPRARLDAASAAPKTETPQNDETDGWVSRATTYEKASPLSSRTVHHERRGPIARRESAEEDWPTRVRGKEAAKVRAAIRPFRREHLQQGGLLGGELLQRAR